MTIRSPLVTLPLLLTLFAACGGESDTSGPAMMSDAAGAAVVLAADPGAATTIVEARAAGPSDDVVIVRGRIQDLTRGFGILKLMDEALHYCGETKPEGCPTPWDYCCDTPEAQRKHELLVEFLGADGKPIETVGLPNTRLLDLIKVRGTLTKNEFGSFVLVADGLWQISRPELPDGLNWPE